MDIPKDVLKFKKEAAHAVAAYASDMFQQDILEDIPRYNITSPIEQLLYIAIQSISVVEEIGDKDVVEIQGELFVRGLNIAPQFQIGRYRVDFEVSYFSISIENSKRVQRKSTVLVECDSQEFHERSEPERRYEKKRDRLIQSMGYQIFRFTGSEIVKNPFMVASEIVGHVTGQKAADILSGIEGLKNGMD